MSKITLTDLANLQNENTAVNAINTNNATLEEAFDNTLSRDGTSPNQMGANLDMNSNRILNLPSPSTAYEPVRLQDLGDYAAGGTVTFNSIPTGGAQGASLIKNSSSNFDTAWSGNALFFDKRSDVTTSKIPGSITSIVISRYDTDYPIQPATYTRGSISSTLAIQDVDGTYWGLSGNTAYPEYFGAKRDGANNDAPALRSCMSYLKTVQPSTMYLGLGTYLLSSFTSTSSIQTAIIGYDGVSIIGQGGASILKLANNMGSGGLDYAIIKQATDTLTDKIDNAVYAFFKIDGNAANNNYNRYATAIYSSHNTNLTIRDLYFYSWPGSQPINLGVSSGLSGLSTTPTSISPRIYNNRFLDIGINSFLTDWSAIYIVSQDFIVANNSIACSSQALYGTAIELHGTGVCSGNVMRLVNQMFNVGSYPDTSAVVTNNHGYFVRSFGTIWETLGGANPSFATKAIISDNVVIQTDNTGQYAVVMNNTSGSLNSYVKVINNYFESLEAAGTSSIAGVFTAGKIKEVEICGNTAVNYAGQFYSQDVAQVVNTQILKIHDNVVVDCCRTSNGAVKNAISINVSNAFNVLSICNNIFKNTSTVYMTNGIVGSAAVTTIAGRGRIVDNLFFNITTPITWTGTGRMEGIWYSYTPTLTAGSGTATSATAFGKYRILNDLLYLELNAAVTTVGTASGDMVLTLPSGYTTSSLGQTIIGRELATGKTVAGYLAASGSSAAVRFYDNTTAWANGNTMYLTGAVQISTP